MENLFSILLRSFLICFLLMRISLMNTADAMILWTKSGSRLQLVTNNKISKDLNWVFLPGGPGLGSDYFKTFVTEANLPGRAWLLDLPGDGSNRLENNQVDYNKWPEALVQAIAPLKNVILVAHSFGGMLVLSTPKLEKHLIGLVLLNSAPNNKWMTESAILGEEFKLPDVSKYTSQYKQFPDDKKFKELTIASVAYFFNPGSLPQGKKILQNLSYNHKAFDWAAKHFHPHYEAKWVPQNIPVLIVGGSKDVLTPIHLFQNNLLFQKSNINIIIIPNASHFSWVGHEKEMSVILKNFSKHNSPNK